MEAYAWGVPGWCGSLEGRDGLGVPWRGEVARGLRAREDVPSRAAGVPGEWVLTGDNDCPRDAREVWHAPGGEGVGQDESGVPAGTGEHRAADRPA